MYCTLTRKLSAGYAMRLYIAKLSVVMCAAVEGVWVESRVAIG